MMRRRVIVSFAVWWTAQAGCSGSVTRSRQDDPALDDARCAETPRLTPCDDMPALDVEEACQRGAEAQCQKDHECKLLPASGLDGCRNSYLQRCRERAQEADQRGHFDGRAAACCYRHFAEVTCMNAQLGDDPACRAMYRGQGSPGAECENQDDCVSSTYCALDARCRGVCTRYAEPGEPCGSGVLCGLGATCVEEVCRSRACLGAPCGGAALPDCVVGLDCLRDGVGSTCQTKASAGQPCDSFSNSCSFAFRCAFTDDPQLDTCQELGGAGSACLDESHCDVDYDCVGEDSERGHAGRCEPVVELGEVCTPPMADEQDPCGAGSRFLRCDPLSRTCVSPLLELGEACEPARDICAYAFCDPDTRRCTELKSRNEECTDGNQCRDLGCIDGKCGSPFACRPAP